MEAVNPGVSSPLSTPGLNEAERLQRFVQRGDEVAFRSLVEAHFNLVYSTALRRLEGDTHLAEDVAQTVFTDLARKAAVLPRRTVLAAWLYGATRRAAAKAVRTEHRRRVREQEALAMLESAPESSADWDMICPLLDDAMAALSAADRNAILLHYFERHGYRAIGAALGISDDAAQKRVARALGKLRTILLRRGVTLSAGSLAVALSAGTAQSAPASLSASICSASLAAASAAGPAGFAAMVLETTAAAKIQIATAAAALLLLVGGITAAAHAARPPQSSGHFVTIDLSARINGDLMTSWTPDYGSNHLQALGRGVRVLKSVPFDVRGVVQLQGAFWKEKARQLPERVEGIPVGSLGRRIHLLHASSARTDVKGTTVATLVVHYADGGEQRLPITQGVHCLDWWEWPKDHSTATDPNTVVAWTGRNPPADHHGATLRLFKTAFVNPQPDKEIQSVDYVSAMADSAPFMVGLTLEQ